jgi:hypothetical protein
MGHRKAKALRKALRAVGLRPSELRVNVNTGQVRHSLGDRSIYQSAKGLSEDKQHQLLSQLVAWQAQKLKEQA